MALRRTGFPEAAEEALRTLPDPVEGGQIAAFLAVRQHPWTRSSAGWAAPPRVIAAGFRRSRQRPGG